MYNILEYILKYDQQLFLVDINLYFCQMIHTKYLQIAFSNSIFCFISWQTDINAFKSVTRNISWKSSQKFGQSNYENELSVVCASSVYYKYTPILIFMQMPLVSIFLT